MARITSRKACTAVIAGVLTVSFGLAAMASGLSISGAELPRVLSADDQARYTKIFALQEQGKWTEADALIKALENDVLMGHVLYQRYMHPTAYRSKFSELKAWMADYADHPGAERIHKLAMRRRPANAGAPIPPQAARVPADIRDIEINAPEAIETPRPETRQANIPSSTRREISTIQAKVRSAVQRGNVTNALDYLNSEAVKRVLDPLSMAESLGIVARGYFRYHLDDKAMAVAATAGDLVGPDADQAHWWGGLAAFRADDFRTAARHFELLSRSQNADSWLRSAGAYWASRAFLVDGNPKLVSPMLQRAADNPHTFYGLMATRALGLEFPLHFDTPSLIDGNMDLLMRIPAAQRALALLEIGRSDIADEEFNRFGGSLPPGLSPLMLAFAEKTGRAGLAFSIGADLLRNSNMRVDGALYPVPGWEPSDGFKVDRALVYAIMRKESQFQPNARSRAGARGLMQLMPATASYMSENRFRGSERNALYDPGLNLSLGQKYVQYVFNLEMVDRNMFYALAAYNAGPGNLQKWRDKIDYDGDPLLFIESLPSRETRHYIEHVLANLWIYRIRLGQDAPTLDDLVSGDWPVYVPQDEDVQALYELETVSKISSTLH